jgi:hypothetical protein
MVEKSNIRIVIFIGFELCLTWLYIKSKGLIINTFQLL